MSTKLVKEEIRRFLKSSNPEVLCIRGRWGTGKTWTWRELLKASSNEIALKKYAYVSLFGLNSLAQVRSQVFQSTIDTSQIGKDFDLDDLEASVKASFSWAKRLIAIANRYYSGSDDLESALSLLALSAREQIVCLDDLERKGKALDAADVLGYASQLKEERKCKVVFLLNDEELDSENREDFDAYLEKVADVSLQYAPTPQESVDIALKGTDEVSLLARKHCLMLGIENVRVITKIHKAVSRLEGLLHAYPRDVFENIVSSVVLLGWIQHQPNTAPTIQFLKSRGKLLFGDKDIEFSEKEIEWKKLLEEYPFNHIDSFDMEIKNGLARGYFSQEAVEAHALELNRRLESGKAMNEWRAAWEAWRYSFISDASSVTKTLADTFIRNTAYHNSEDLNTLYDLCIRVGEDATATQVLDHFISVNQENIEALDVDKAFYHGENFHPEVKAALNAAYTAAKPKPTFEELLISLTNSYSSETVEALNQYTVSDFERVFLAYEGEEMRVRIVGVTDLRRLANPSPQVTSVVEKVRGALCRIGATTPVNRERVERTWGVKLPSQSASEAEAPVATSRESKAAEPRASKNPKET